MMQGRSGMGETGEIYLVGQDGLMRSDSYLDSQNHSVFASFANPDVGVVDTEASREALSGVTGAKIVTGYNGNPVLSAYTPIRLEGFEWVLLAEIDVGEAFASVAVLKNIMLVVVAVALVVIIFLVIMIARSIANPLIKMVDMLKDIAEGEGDLTKELEVASSDEIGELASWFNTFVRKLRGMVERIQDASEGVASAALEISASSAQLSKGAELQASAVEEASSSIAEMSASIASVADDAQSLASNVGQTTSSNGV